MLFTKEGIWWILVPCAASVNMFNLLLHDVWRFLFVNRKLSPLFKVHDKFIMFLLKMKPGFQRLGSKYSFSY
jgi:hypothetical protein